MSRATMFIPPAGLRRLEYYNFMYHNSLNGLVQEAIDAGRKLWKIRPKGHQNHVMKCIFSDVPFFPFGASRILQRRLDHLCLDVAPQINPLHVSNYQEEDHVGRMKRLAVACHPEKLGQAVLERWC